MLDINFIRENADLVKKTAKNKLVEVDIEALLELDDRRKELQAKSDEINRQRKENEATFGTLNKDAKDLVEKIRNKGKELKEEGARLEDELGDVQEKWQELMYKVPNIPSDDTPVGKDESDNKILKTVNEKPIFDFKPKEHWELGQELGIIDTETAAKVSGSRFTYVKGDLVLLQFALLQYGMSVLTNEEKLSQIIKDAGIDAPATSFIPVLPPVFIREEVYSKMGRLEPREQRYHLEGTDQWLIGSAEHTLGPMFMKHGFAAKDLPLRFVGYSTAFRQEAGTYGKDMKGMFRNHQFDKLEMESFATPEQGRNEHNLMVAIQEHLMASLGLHYQVVLKGTADMGTPNHRGVDIETWLPGQNAFRETHTADYMTDYQSRRLGTKVQVGDTKEFVHMNDATAYAGRALIAIIETYQTTEGTIKIPEVLIPYMHGITEIKKK